MRKILLILLTVFLAINSGCVYRKLTVRTNPPDATMYLNDKLVGQTPLEFDFMYYARHTIRLEKPGYETFVKQELIKTPSYLYIPLDLIAEILPYKFKDYRELSYELTPIDLEELPAE